MSETPQLPVAAFSRHPVPVLEDGPDKPALVVLHSDALRDLQTQTCLQCGINQAGPPQMRTLQHVPPWVYLGLLGHFGLLAILYFAGRRRLDAVFRLCPDCAAADTRGRRLRSWSLAGLLVFPILGAVIGAALDSIPLCLGGASTGFVAGIAAIIASARKTRHAIIFTKHIDKRAGTVTLLASPSWQRVLDAEAREALATTPR